MTERGNLGENIPTMRDRKRRIEGKVTPEVLSSILLDEVTGRLEDIALLLETTNQRLLEHGDTLEKIYTEMAKKPVGLGDSYIFDANDQFRQLVFTEAWFSVSIHNDGPNPVKYALNKQGLGTAPITPGEFKILDLHDAKIHSLAFQCDPGQTANLRIFALR